MATNEPQTVSQFAQEKPEPTELERIQQRIADYKVGFTVNSAGVINALIQSHLQSGKVTQGELVPLHTVTEEYAAGLAEYNQIVENAQRRSQELIAADQLAKAEAFEKTQQEQQQRLADERVARKEANNKIAQLEAVLASHGIGVDLNGDGVIGVKQGTLNKDGFVEMSAEEVAVLAKKHGYKIPQPPAVQQTPLQKPSKRTGNMGLARAMNPAVEETPADEGWDANGSPVSGPTEEHPIPLDTPQSHTKVETEVNQTSFVPTGTTAESFFDEVARVEEVAQADEFVEEITDESYQSIDNATPEEWDEAISYDEAFNEKVAETKQAFEDFEEETGFEVSDEVEPLGSEFSVQEEDVRTESEFAKPVITGGNFKPRAETLQTGDTVSAPAEKAIPSYDSEEELLAAAQAKIDQKVQDDIDEKQFNESFEEESYDEITIPSSAELEAMTKKGIVTAADELNFTMDSSQTKAQMIESFQDQTDELIKSLQDDGSFVSAVDSDEGSDNDNDTVRDGGYF